MGKLTDEYKAAEKEYTQSLNDIADTTKTQYEENKDFSTFANEADSLAREQQRNQMDLNTATRGSTTPMVSQSMVQNTPTRQVDVANAYNKKKAADATKLGYMQFASEEAKMKYQLAAQAKAQAQARWNNAGKILQGLGCALSAIPGIGWAIGGATAIAGTAIGAAGSANV